MGYMKSLAIEIHASLQTTKLYLEHALECLTEGDVSEARGFIDDAIAEIKRQEDK